MANAMVALATTTLGSAASSVTFGSIPAIYRDLRIVFAGSIDTGDRLLSMQFNADTASNYSRVQMVGSGSGSGTSSTLNGVATDLFYSATANLLINSITDIMDYSATDKHKSVLTRANDSANYVFANANRWASTSAITSIKLFPTTTAFAAASNFNAGSSFSLYGVLA